MGKGNERNRGKTARKERLKRKAKMIEAATLASRGRSTRSVGGIVNASGFAPTPDYSNSQWSGGWDWQDWRKG